MNDETIFQVEYILNNETIKTAPLLEGNFRNLQEAHNVARPVDLLGGTYIITKMQSCPDPASPAINCMLWWGTGRAGYTTDLDKAHVFTQEEKSNQHTRDTDVWWPKNYIDEIASKTVDCQKARKDEV